MKLIGTIGKMILGGIIAFAILNIVIALWFIYADSRSKTYNNLIADYYQMDLGPFYPGLSSADVDQLIGESFQAVQYEPLVGFRERPRHGRFVNVTEEGYRLSSGQSPWPPNPDAPIIFVFGGSTTFGYGVADKDTVVSRLSERLRRHPAFANAQVYNFGRAFYWSTQESILFQRLIAQQRVPTLAIFIDGMNEFYHTTSDPDYTDVMRAAFEQNKNWNRASGREKWEYLERSLQQAIFFLPFSRLLRELLPKPGSRGDELHVIVQPNDPKGLEFSIRNYQVNVTTIKAIARQLGIKPYFVWQPAAMYHNPPNLNAQHEREFVSRRPEGYGPHSPSYYGYPRMAEVFAQSSGDAAMIWCADAFQQATRQLYVDIVHYNGYGAGLLADCIADRITAAQ
jgi:hypothetical protein